MIRQKAAILLKLFPRRGYRFLAAVEITRNEPASANPPEATDLASTELMQKARGRRPRIALRIAIVLLTGLLGVTILALRRSGVPPISSIAVLPCELVRRSQPGNISLMA